MQRCSGFPPNSAVLLPSVLGVVPGPFPFYLSWAVPALPPELTAFFCPAAQLLLMECELLVANQYLRALMQKKMVCKSKEERRQFCDRLLQDATQLRELFCSLVRGARRRWGAGGGL